MTVFEVLLTAILGLLGSGTAVAVVNALKSRRRDKSEVTDINVKTAIDLEKVAMTRYTDISTELSAYKDATTRAIAGLEEKLEGYLTYIKTLQNLLKDHKVNYPEMNQH